MAMRDFGARFGDFFRRCFALLSGRNLQGHFYFSENQKGTAGRGREKNVTTICDKRHDILRHFTTFCDNFRLFVPLT